MEYNKEYAKKVYAGLSKRGYTEGDLGSEDLFVARMGKENNRRLLYDMIARRGDANVGSWERFNERMSVPDIDKSQYTLGGYQLGQPIPIIEKMRRMETEAGAGTPMGDDIYRTKEGQYTRTEVPFRTIEYPSLGMAQMAAREQQREDALAAYRSAYNRLEAPGEVDERTLIEWGNNMDNAPIEQKNLYTRIMGKDATNRVDLDAVMRSYDETKKSLEGVEDPEGLAAYLIMPAEQRVKLPEAERKKYEDILETKRRDEAVEGVNELHNRLSSLMEDQRKADIEMHRNYRENRSTKQAIIDAILGIPVAEAPHMQGIVPSSGLEATPEGKQSNEQNATLTAAGRKWNEMKYIINAAKDGNIFDGLDKALGSVDTWTSDQILKDNMAITRVANKFDKEGEGALTDNEKALLDALALNVAVSEMYGDEISAWYKGGEMIGEMAPFMIEMLMNPLSGVGKKAADKVTRRAIEKYGKELVKKKAGRFALKRGAAKLGASVAGATGMALTTGLPAVGADTQKRMLGDATYGYDDEGNIEYTGHVGGEDLGTSAYKAVTSRMLDNVSEMLGAGYAKIPFKWLQKAGKGTKVLGWIDNLANSKFGKGVSRFAEKTKWNGPIEEFLEEVHVGLLNPVMVGDQSWEEFFTADNLATIAIGVAVPGAVISTANTIAGAADGAFKVGAQERWKMQNAEAMGYQLWQDNPNEWKDLTNSLMVGQMEDIEKTLKEVYNNPNLTPEQKKTALEYGVYSLQLRTAKGVEEAFNEGKKFIDPMLRDVYGTAYAERVSPVQANNAYKAMAEAEKNAQRVLGIGDRSVDEWLNGRTAEEAARSSKEKLAAIKAYQTAKLDFEGRRDRYIAEKERAYMESDRSIQKNDNNGMVYATQLEDEPVYITGGNVVLNEDGTIDVNNSSEALYVKFPDGHVEMTSPDKFTEVFTEDRTEDLKAAKRAEIDAKWKAEFDTAEAQSVEQEKRDSGVVFNMTDAQGEHRIEILNEGEKISDILMDGNQVQIPTEELNRWKQEAGIQTESAVGDNTTDNVAPTESEANVALTGDNVAPVAAVELPDVPDFFRLGGKNYSVASRNDDGSVDVMVDGKRETLPAGTDYSTHMPTDKKGEVQYEQIPVERTHEYFVQKVKDDEARAEMIEKRRKKAEAERKKFDKKPDPGFDPDAYEAKMTQWEADKKAAQAKVDYWNEVAKRETEITRSETREAVENIKPDVVVETADEFIANQLAGIKITPESFKRETGLSNAEQAQAVGVISNDGVSVERAAEIITENYDSELKALGFTGDMQDVRDIIIDVLSQGNPRSYARKGREAREAENVDQQRAEAEAWSMGTFNMSLDELYVYEETAQPRMIRDYEGFDENEYYNNLAENYENDTTRESESTGRGGELLQGEQPVPAGGTPVAGQRNEGGTVSDDVQGGGQNGIAQEEVPVNEPELTNDVKKEAVNQSEDNLEMVAEGDAPGKSSVYADNQGNPVDADGKLIVDEVNSIDEITDEDFETPTRNVQLPAIPENVANAIGTNGRPVVIKRNVFEKNGNTHVELEPEDSRNILRSALYNPNLVGSTQPIRRPDYKVAIRTGEQNAVVVLDVYQEKDFVEIVGWRMVNEKGLAKMQRQAEREGGQFLILSPNDGSAAALSALPLGLSSASEDRNSVSNSQENAQKNAGNSTLEQIKAELKDLRKKIAVNGNKLKKMLHLPKYMQLTADLRDMNSLLTTVTAEQAKEEYGIDINKWDEVKYDALWAERDQLKQQIKAAEERLKNAESRKQKEESTPEIQEPRSVEEMLDNGDKRITNYNSRGEVATVATERDGKVVSVDSYDEGVLFEHTEYDGNGKATAVTRYDKSGNVVGTQVYEDGKAVPSGKQKTESGKQNGKQKAKTPMQKLADQVLARAEEKRRIPLRERARELEAQVGVKANIIESLNEVKNREARERIAAGEAVAGWYSGGQVYLYMPNIKDRREIELTYVHEVVAHHGVKKLLGERFNEFLDGVWNMMSEADRARMLAYVGVKENPTLQDMRAAADEYVAELAEKMNLGELEQSTWEKIVDWFKKILENIGFENLKKEDIESMLKASYANLRSTEQGAESKENDFRARMTFHGSGAQFDRFNHAFMGTGEGAQAFGWGTYVTEVEGIGKQYANEAKRTFATDEVMKYTQRVLDGERFVSEIENELRKLTAITNYANPSEKASVKGNIERLQKKLNVFTDELNRDKQELDKWENEASKDGGRNLYSVEIPDDNGSNYLHWEDVVPKKVETAVKERLLERLSEGQGEAYKSDLKQELDDVFRYSDFDGASLYKNISAYLGGDKQASLFLNDMGFVGISYPAEAMTGGRADGARNYVIFNENDAQIKDRTQFRISRTPQEFDATQAEAVEKRGIVAPGLNEAVVNVVDVPRHDFTGTGKEAIDKAKLWAKENLVGEYTANEGTENEFRYSIDDKSIKKYLSGVSTSLSDNLGVHLSVLKALPNVINESVEVEVHADYKKGNGRSVDNGIEDENLLIHRLYGAVYINGELHRVKTTLKERKAEGVKPYTYEVTKIELIGGSSPKGTSLSDAPNNSISAAKLLEGVEKSYDKGKKVLDESENSSENPQDTESGIRFRTRPMTKEEARQMVRELIVPFAKELREEQETRFRATPTVDGKPFHENSYGLWKILPKSEWPQGEPDYVSRNREGGVSSQYWYGEDEGGEYIIRKSDHWSADISRDKEAGKFMSSLPYRLRTKAIRSVNWALDYRGSDFFNRKNKEYFEKEDGKTEKYGKIYLKDLQFEDGGTRFRIANENQDIFVSNAQRAIEGIQQNKATAEQWIAMLKKNGGLKAGEDAWLGLEEWLNEKQGAVTKQEILDFIGENKIQIEAVKYSENARFKGQSYYADRYNAGEADDVMPANDTRLNYTTEGLENKREIALVVPTIESWNASDEIHFGDAGNGRAVAWVRFGETTVDTEETIAAKKAVNDYLAEMREKHNTLEGEETDAMTAEEIERLQELTAKEIESGEKKARVLVIDEIQSKRHQEGREKGYIENSEEKRKALREYRDSLLQKYNTRRLRDVEAQATTEELQRLDELDKAIIGVPSAPFEKNWHELAMKRMLRLAAEEGFDKVAWTTGEQQAERYNIGAVVNRIESNDTVDYDSTLGVDLVKQVALFTRDGNAITLRLTPEGIVRASSRYNGHHISDIVGKELGNRIMTETDLVLKEQDLRIGGEGMKGFYDRMLPSFVQKYTKKWGAKVGEVTMPSLEENNTMWSVDVTPEMQESVMQGQTMFRMGSRVDARMAEVAAHFEGKQLTAEQQAVVDVFGGKADNLTISVKTKDGNERRVVMRQGNEMGAGAKHSLFRHFGMNNGAITADDILLIPEILANGEHVEKKRGKKTVIEYKYTDNNGVEYTVITENNKGREEFANFYTNRKASSAARKTRSEEARDTADDASEGKGSDNSSNTQEEDARFRTVEETTDGSIDDVPAQPLTLMERITNSLLEVSAKNKENLGLRADALRTFGKDITRVLSVMKAQKEYDKSTVDTLVKLAKMYFKNAQLLGEVDTYTMGRVLSLINNVVGKRDVTASAAKLMDILLDAHTKALAGILDKAEKVKAKKVNAAGVEVMGRLDKYGQKRVDEYRAAKEMTPKKLEEAIYDSDNRLAELEQRVREELGLPEGDVDQAARDYTGDNDVVNVYMDERARLEGLTLAREYKESIQQVLEEIKDLKRELKQAEEDYRLGNIDGKSLKEFRKSVSEAIMESKAGLIEGYHSLIYKFQENTKESSKRAKAFAQAQIDRAREIQHNANSDMEGISAATQGTHPENYNNAVMNALRSPFPTLQGMLKKFGEKNVEGKGYLYERFMPQATKAGDNEFRGKVAARVMIDGKLKEIYGKKMTIAKFMKQLREYGATVTYREGNEMKQFDLTKGQMLYIYMVNKMADGQMKLRRMGITDDVVAELMTKLPEAAVQFADWAQNELLKDLRGKYNAVHERVFGAPMAAIENYFPIKIRKEARGEKGDVSEVGQEGKPSTVTGSIIKRTKNATAIDLSVDAMQVLMEYIDDMEHWAAFAEFNRDLNVLLNYKHFQNQVKNMISVRYGSGEEMWKNFKKTAQIASGTYRPSDSSIDRAVQNIAKGLTRSKINFRLFTAVKQLLSAPAFWTDAGVKELAYCYVNPKGSFDWAKENLPGFAERWQGRTMGNEKLLKSDSDWEVWRNKFVEKATRWGMTPNAAIDALTVAQGARAVYMTKLEQFKKAGYTEQRANEKALQAAAEAYNESQQSSEGAYLSPLQVEGTVASVIFSTFKNSNFGYTRKTAQAVANIKRKMRKGYKEETIAFMTKQMVRDGLSEENAKRFAEKVYNKSKYKDVANVAMFGFGLNLLWEAGGMAIYLLLGDDDEEKEKMMKEIALRGSLGLLNGIPFGETMISAAMAVKEGDTKYFRLPELVAVSDIKNLAQVFNYDSVRGANDIVNMLVSMGVGVSPQVLTDILVAFGDVEEFSAEEFAMFVARFVNAPQSNLDRLMVDDAMENSAINAEEIMRRYAEYKKSKNAPITQFFYPEEGEKKVIERYEKRFEKLLDERLENVVEDNDAYDLFYKGADARRKSELAKMRQKYLAEDKAKALEKLDSKELVDMVLNSTKETNKDINEEYFNLTNAEDEDTAFVIKIVKKALDDLKEGGKLSDKERGLLSSLNSLNYAINNAKRLMEQQPERAQEHMNKIREMRAKAIELINNYRKDE